MAHDSATVTVTGVNIRSWRAGQGKTVVFLHGAGGIVQWLPFFDALAECNELLVPEHPGFGGSDDPAWIRNVPDLAMFYLDFLETLGLRDVHIVGHSLGGWIAAELAVRDCSRLNGLTLIAPAGLRIKGVLSGDNFIWGPQEALRNLFYDQAFAERAIAAPVSDEQAELMLKNRFAAAKYGWQPRWFNPDLEKWLHRIKVPTRIFWGDSDKVLPPAYGRSWQQRIADCTLTLIERSGHLPHVEKAEQMARLVRSAVNGAAP